MKVTPPFPDFISHHRTLFSVTHVRVVIVVHSWGTFSWNSLGLPFETVFDPRRPIQRGPDIGDNCRKRRVNYVLPSLFSLLVYTLVIRLGVPERTTAVMPY